ncbi:MAG: formate dehydrogenase accessory protein FdhE [Gemmataceae bacterium]
MAADFLRRLVARAPSPEVRDALQELDRVAAERPTLAAAAEFLRHVLPVLFAEPVAIMPLISAPSSVAPSPPALRVRGQGEGDSVFAGAAPLTPPSPPAKPGGEGAELEGADDGGELSGEVPLLRGLALPPDANFARRWGKVCAAAHAPEIAEALSRGKLDATQMIADLLAGQPAAIHDRATELGLDAGQIATILRHTLFPMLATIAATRPPSRWDHGHCPVCGSWPLLGEFRGLEQTRFLRCGLCAAGWEFPRLRCPFCATTDHDQLGYFFVEGEDGKYRVTACNNCRGYVKMVSTLGELSPARLLVADVATLHLDLAAADRGFAI